MARTPMTSGNRAAVNEAAWAIALRYEDPFGYAEIAADAHISVARASALVRLWVQEGRCEVVQEGHRLRKLHRVVGRAARLPEPVGTVPGNLWNSMRGLKSFSPVDLAAHSTTPDVIVTLAAAQAYCQTLLRAGYLRVERTAIPGRREAIYRLIRNSGPRPPRERRVRAVWDENLAEYTHIAGVPA